MRPLWQADPLAPITHPAVMLNWTCSIQYTPRMLLQVPAASTGPWKQAGLFKLLQLHKQSAASPALPWHTTAQSGVAHLRALWAPASFISQTALHRNHAD